MRIGDLGEFGFIDRIKNGCLNRKSGVVAGIGDDCAVFRVPGNLAVLLTTDMLIEDVHFRLSEIPPYFLGRKSLAVSISDIAAMGGTPREALVSIGIPGSIEVVYLDEIYKGLKAIATEYDINILGGDTVLSPDRLVINVALSGEERDDEILYRSGALEGDVIFIAGTLGRSAAGLDLLRNKREFEKKEGLLTAHFDPIPHVWSGRIIASSKLANSMIDISDGLVGDLWHVCKESGVGALIEMENMPIDDNLREYCERYRLDLERFVLYGGEDYVLMGTVATESSDLLRESLKAQDCDYFPIGKMVDGDSIKLRENGGTIRELARSGYDHFSGE